MTVFSRSVTCTAAAISLPKSRLTILTRWQERRQKLAYSCGRKSVRLNRIGQLNHTDRSLGLQLGAKRSRSATAGIVTIQHQNHTLKTCQQGTLLRWVQHGPHQCHHGRRPGLVHLEAIEETFDDHDRGLPRRGGAVQIKQDLRFGEPSRETVSGLGSIQRPAGIGHQFSARIMDGNDQPSAENPRPGIETDPKFPGGGRCNPAAGQVGVSAIHAAQGEAQGFSPLFS